MSKPFEEARAALENEIHEKLVQEQVKVALQELRTNLSQLTLIQRQLR